MGSLEVERKDLGMMPVVAQGSEADGRVTFSARGNRKEKENR